MEGVCYCLGAIITKLLTHFKGQYSNNFTFDFDGKWVIPLGSSDYGDGFQFDRHTSLGHYFF